MAQSSLLSCSFATSGVQRVKTSFTPMPLLSTLLPAPSLVCLKMEFTKEEIQLVVKQYGDAAKRCQKAGIDIIEIHAGIGYMVMRFISKYSNHRTDEYGGDTKGRASFSPTSSTRSTSSAAKITRSSFVTLQTTLCPAVSALKTSRRSSRL